MNFRTTLILALVFCVGLAAVLLIKNQDTRKKEKNEIAGKLLDIDKSTITELILEPALLHFIKDGENWNIVAPVETDGDKSAVDAILNMFDWAKIERTIVSNPAEYSDYGLAPEFGKMILVHDGKADTLFVGEETPTGSFVFARKNGLPEVFLTTTSLQSNIQKSLFDVRNKKVLRFDVNNIKELVITNRKGTIELFKAGADWMIKGKNNVSGDISEIIKLTNRLNSETAKEFVDENPADLQKYGLTSPAFKINILLGEDKAKATLFIGKDIHDKYYAKDDSRKPVFLVDSAFVNLFNVAENDLRSKDIVQFTQSTIDKIELDYARQTIICEKDTANNWLVVAPDSGAAKSYKITSLLSDLSSLKAEEFVNDNPASLEMYGLAKPQLTCKIYQKGILYKQVLVGKEKGTQVYAMTADSKSVYLVNKDNTEKLKPKLEDILDVEKDEKTLESENM